MMNSNNEIIEHESNLLKNQENPIDMGAIMNMKT